MSNTSSEAAPHLLFMVGSLRKASASRALANTIAERIGTKLPVSFADIGGLPLYNADLTDHPEISVLTEQVRAADGVVFITPEYNYSVPGVLKNAIDWASRPAYQSPFFHKKCFMITLSAGAMGGVRAQGHLKQILNGMAAHVFPSQEVVVPFGNDKVEDGRFTHEPTLDFALLKLEEFSRFVRTA